ncbi:MAG: plasmid partition protein ParG [Eubacteriales bacterium]|nr:plasmid partition protein ParG [Eubacteriales bacterium]
MPEKDKYAAQKKYLATRKKMSVWVDADKYERFKAAVKENGESVYGLINRYIDDYLEKHES